MQVYHLGVTMFAKQLTGEGAKLYGGRWNMIGHACIYACQSKAMCALEYAANVSQEDLPDDLSFTTYDIPDESWITFPPKDLPVGWDAIPPPASTQKWGTEHLENKFAICVPSVIIPEEFNFVLNPLHPDFKKVKIKAIEPFIFDRRIKQ